MAEAASYAVGMDIGGTQIKVVAVTPNGDLLDRETFPTDERSDDWLAHVRAALSGLTERRGSPPMAVGLAAPGLARPDGRSILWMQGRMDVVQGLDWTEALGGGRFIPIINDAHAALLGEAWRGAAAGARHVVLLTLGTGVGGGALVNGRLLKGRMGRGGHLGHMSVKDDPFLDITGCPGSLESAIGECTLLQRSKGRFTATRDLVAAHRAGDAEATNVWLASVRSLARGVVSLINLLDPEIVILGGGIANAGDALFLPLQEAVDAWEWRPTGEATRIVPAALGEWAGAYGAAYSALNWEQL